MKDIHETSHDPTQRITHRALVRLCANFRRWWMISYGESDSYRIHVTKQN